MRGKRENVPSTARGHNRSIGRQPKIEGEFEQRRITSKHFESKRIPFTSGGRWVDGVGRWSVDAR